MSGNQHNQNQSIITHTKTHPQSLHIKTGSKNFRRIKPQLKITMGWSDQEICKDITSPSIAMWELEPQQV